VKKTLLIFFFLFLATDLFPSTNLRVGVYDNPHLIYTKPDGNVKGLYADILEYIALNESWKIEYIPGSFEICLKRLENKNIDILFGIGYSDERTGLYDFNRETVLSNWGEVYLKKDSDIKSLLGLENKKLAVLENDIYYIGPNGIKNLLNNLGITCEFIEMHSYQLIFDYLDKNLVDAGVVNRLFGEENYKNYNIQKSSIIFSPIELRFAFPKNAPLNSILIERIDKYLCELKGNNDSIYYRSIEKYFGKEEREKIVKVIPKWVIITLIVITGMLLLFFTAIIVLRRLIKKKTYELALSNKKLEEDVIKLKEIENNLKKERNLLRTFIDNLPDYIYMKDIKGRFVLANKKLSLLMGKENPDELIGKTDFDLYPGKFAELYFKDEQTIIKTGRPLINKEDIIIDPKGEKIWILNTKIPLFDSDGNVTNIVGIMHDITEKKLLEQQLVQAQKMESIGTLAGGIVHDFNNILSAILGYASLMKMKINKDNSFYNYVDIIEKSAIRASELTSQLLSFSRGGAIYNKRPMNLNNVINEIINIIKSTFDKSIETEYYLFDDLPTIEADASQIHQVIMNLCVNARDAMPDGGKLIIETDVETLSEEYVKTHIDAKVGRHIILTVTDTGIGMDEEIKKRIFEPFYTTKKQGKGTGLGLSMVYGIIKSHDGFVNVYSERGNGTTFKVYLPASVKAEEIKSSNITKLKRGDELILLVDDEKSIRDFGKNILESYGYRVLLADNGEMAIKIYDKHKDEMGLVILDLIMPELGGKETFLRIKDINPDEKVIISSGYSPNGMLKDILDIGAKGFIQKPYLVNDLLFKVRDILDS